VVWENARILRGTKVGRNNISSQDFPGSARRVERGNVAGGKHEIQYAN